jgi:hypothetical protein
MKYNKTDIKKAAAYGAGVMCGKHDLPLTHKQIKVIANDALMMIETDKESKRNSKELQLDIINYDIKKIKS